MKFALGIFSLVNHAMCMQMSVHPNGDFELMEELVEVHEHVPCPDDDPCGTEFALNGADPANNNLGGKGPLEGPEEIRFKNAAKIHCQDVDLVMTTASDYTPGMMPNTGNGAEAGFGKVTLASGTSVDVEFSLVDSSTGAPVDVDEFTIFVYDLDMGKRGRGKESVTACGATSVKKMVDLESNTAVKSTTDGDCTTFEAMQKGSKHDNPTDRNALDDVMKNRVVQATWANANKVNMKMAIGTGGDGRGMMFTATAKTVCTTTTTTPAYSTPPPKPVDPHTKCQDGQTGGTNCSLDDVCEQGVETEFFKMNIVHNNLGGLGPNFADPPIMQYTKVATHHDRGLDLIVTASSTYKDQNWNYRRRTGQAMAAAYNGAEPGGAGAVFSMAAISFDVTFKLVWTDTQLPAVIPHWMMTYYDLDGNFETVNTCDAISVATFDKTTMQGPGCSAGCCTMKGAAREYQEPPNWDNLADYYKEDAVTFVFKDKSEAKFTYVNTRYHRMWFFKGSKALACGSR